MPTSFNFNNYYTDAEKLYADKRNTAYTDNTNLYAAQADSTNLSYDAQVNNAKSAYEDSYRENAVQKLINERQVAENMANLGLTNSGLNRTQQTAVQLSYANNKADIDKQKQSQIDALNLARTQDLNTIEQNRLASEASIKEYYENLINETAMNNYTADVEAETERLKAEAEAETERQKNYLSYLSDQEEEEKQESYIIKTNGANLSRDFEGSLADNGVTVRYTSNGKTVYTDTKSGKSTTVDSSVNPYTGYNNATGTNDTAKAWNKYGCFDNGYQPKGVVYQGKEYGTVSFSGIWDTINGNEQRVHKTSDGSLWIWDGKYNKYKQYKQKEGE